MGDDVDSELAANVKAARTKRMHFAFVAKGSNDGALVISKSKVSPVMISVAKKKAGAGPISHGACFGEEGTIVFEMAHEAPATMEAALKHVIQRDAGIVQKCVCRREVNPDLGGEPQIGGEPQPTPLTNSQTTKPQPSPLTNSQTTKPQPSPLTNSQTTKPEATLQKPSTQSQPSDLAGKYSSLEQEISPKLTKALKEKVGDTEKMKTVFKFSRDNAGKKQYEKAIQGLSALSGLIKTGYSTVPTGSSSHSTILPESETTGGETEDQVDGKPKMPYDVAGDFPNTSNYSVPVEGFSNTSNYSAPVEGLSNPSNYSVPIDGGSNPSRYSAPANFAHDDVDDGSEVEDEFDWPGSEEEEEGDEEFAEAQLSEEEKRRRKKEEQAQELLEIRDSSAYPQTQLHPDLIDSEWGKNIDLSGYKAKKVLGKGTFGATELLKQKGKKPLVVKVPLDLDGIADLQKEVDFYKKVGEHPNFVKCLGIADVDGQRGLVLEAVKGKDMGKSMNLLKQQYASGKLSHEQYWGAVQHTMRQTLEAIAHLESVGVVHNDIRMDNIMCDEETGQMKVLDFGISVNSGEKIGKAPIGYGTVSPDGSAPKNEQGHRLKQGVDSKHDAFSVGAATYQAGEGEQFDYHSGKKDKAGWQDIFAFGDPDSEGNRNQAIRPGDKDNPAFTMEKQTFQNEMTSEERRKEIAEENDEEVEDADVIFEKSAKKVAGRSGANTSYTDFVNQLMHPDKEKRLSPAEALLHPFIAESLMDEKQAREVMKNMLAPPKENEADETEEEQAASGGESGGEAEESKESEEEGVEQVDDGKEELRKKFASVLEQMPKKGAKG